MESILERPEQLQRICSFIEDIGIPIKEGEANDQTFLPGIEIVNGGIVYNNEKLLYPGDLLHEAGHISLVPAEFRPKTSGNMKDLDFSTDGEEIGVLLWTYAACLHIGLPPEVVFHPYGYKGQSEWLIEQFTAKQYIGLPLLQWMELCHRADKEPGFPLMQKWLRD